MDYPISRFSAAIVAVTLALTPGQGLAQMGYQACSLEWLVADSDVVVRASVVKVVPEVRDTVTLKILETLKGDKVGTLSFDDWNLANNKIYEGWRDAGREQLWFLVRAERRGEGKDAEADGVAGRHRLMPYGGGWSVIRLGPAVPEERGFVSMPPPIFTMRLDVLRRPEDILEAARAAEVVGRERQRVQGHGIELPREVMHRSGRSGDGNTLTVPVDRRLEDLGRRLIESAGDFLPEPEKSSKDRLRLEGVRALRHFPSDKNTLLLKSLLDDPTFSFHVSPEGTKEKVYDLREAAYESLRSWGVVVGKPVLREASREDGDETLRFYLSRTEMVVAGEICTEPTRTVKEAGVIIHRFNFQVTHVITGPAPGARVSVDVIRPELTPEDAFPRLRKGGKYILFLKPVGDWVIPTWETVDVWFGIQPHSHAMHASLKRLTKGLSIRMPKDSDSVDDLLAALKNSNEQTRTEAIDILGRKRERRAIGPLIELLADLRPLDGFDNWIGGHAANALIEITGGPQSISQEVWREWWRKTEGSGVPSQGLKSK